MKFRDFRAKVDDLPFFNLNDIRKFDEGFYRQQLSYWVSEGLVRKLAGGFYALAEVEVEEDYLYMLANKVYEPSYVSLESALAFWGVIPETVFGVRSVSSRKTAKFETEWGDLSYRKIKRKCLTGFEVLQRDEKIKFKMASLGKAVLDYLYLNDKVDTIDDFEGLRWNKEALRRVKEKGGFMKYLPLFESKALEARVDKLWEYLDA